MATSSTPLLNLDTLAHAPTIRIDGELHELAAPDALSVSDYRRLQILIPRLEELWKLETPTPEEEQELQDIFNRICRVVLRAPVEVHNKLTDIQRVLIYQAFLKLPQATLQLARAIMISEGTPRANRPTGEKSPRASHASTQGPAPTTGSTRSRSRSSARA